MTDKLHSLIDPHEENITVCFQPFPDGPLVNIHGDRAFQAANTIKLLAHGGIDKTFFIKARKGKTILTAVDMNGRSATTSYLVK